MGKDPVTLLFLVCGLLAVITMAVAVDSETQKMSEKAKLFGLGFSLFLISLIAVTARMFA